MDTIYYHNPRCSKSRQGLAFLEERNVKFQIKDYLKDGLSLEEIMVLSEKLSLHPSDFIRKKEAAYQDLESTDFSIEEWATLIHKYPVLLERPILVVGDKAVIGRPSENFLALIA